MAVRLRSLFRSCIALIASVVLMFGVAPQALAHDSVVGGSVEEGEVLDAFPQEITLEFSAVPKEGFNTFAVTNTDTGEVVYSEEPTAEGRNLSVDTPAGIEAGSGHYQLGYQITSSDGHATRGSLAFEVAAPAGAQSSAPEASPAAATTSQQPGGPESEDTAPAQMSGALKFIVGVGGVLAILAVVAMLVMKSRRSDSEG